jgi:hypothetical protein
MNDDGVLVLNYEYDEKGHVTRESYTGPNGELRAQQCRLC